MITFKDTPVTYEQFLASAKSHVEQDKLIREIYWDTDKGKGCAVGCLLDDYTKLYNIKHDDLASYEKLFGIPRQIAELQDVIHEGLPEDETKDWLLTFASTIQPNQDLSLVWPRFAHWLLVDSEHGVINYTDNAKDAIRAIATLYQSVIDGHVPSNNEWIAAWDTAWDTAGDAARAAAWDTAWGTAWDTAWYAAKAVAWDTAGDGAWDTARDAVGYAARAAAWAAAGDGYAARAAKYQAMRDKLIALIHDAPIVSQIDNETP